MAPTKPSKTSLERRSLSVRRSPWAKAVTIISLADWRPPGSRRRRSRPRRGRSRRGPRPTASPPRPRPSRSGSSAPALALSPARTGSRTTLASLAGAGAFGSDGAPPPRARPGAVSADRAPSAAAKNHEHREGEKDDRREIETVLHILLPCPGPAGALLTHIMESPDNIHPRVPSRVRRRARSSRPSVALFAPTIRASPLPDAAPRGPSPHCETTGAAAIGDR